MINNSVRNVVGIHQPNYLPWLGYFVKINSSDTFVFHDLVEFSKNSFTKRVKIRSDFNSLESKYLSVPLIKKSDFTLIKDIEISNNIDWRVKHLAQIYNSYSKCDHFSEWNALLKEWYAKSTELKFLAELNIFFIESICTELGIEANFYRSSQLVIKEEKNDLNLGIVNHLNGDAYCSGTGGIKYQSPQLYSNNNIEFYLHRTFDVLNEKPYLLDEQKFINGLSILDALFFLGSEATVKLIQGIPIEKLNS